MRKQGLIFVLSWLMSCLMLLPALAEGIGTKRGKIYVPPSYTSDVAPTSDAWSGAFVGLHVPWLYNLDDTGLGLGGEVGIRQHWGSNVVLGASVEASYIFSGLQEAERGSDERGVHSFAELSWLGSVRLLAGYNLGVFLPYATVGWGLAQWEATHAESSDTLTVNGLVWGGGVEAKLSERTSLKLDWSRYEFGTFDDVNLTQDVLKLTYNVRF